MGKFLKGIIVGIGGVSPGLSGSVMMVIFGLYEKCVESIGTFFKDIKGNLKFLVPLFAGFGVGVLLFGKIISFLLKHYEMYTRFTFLGLVLGTLPLFYKEVKKNGFSKKYYIIIVITIILGFLLFSNNVVLIEKVTTLNFLQSIFLGLIIAASTIIPGIDSAVILSSLGLYDIYVNSIAALDITVLLPALIGVGSGALLFSFIINRLIKSYYTLTFSIIFGLFITIIPSVLDQGYSLGMNAQSFISIGFLVVGFVVSYLLSKIKKLED